VWDASDPGPLLLGIPSRTELDDFRGDGPCLKLPIALPPLVDLVYVPVVTASVRGIGSAVARTGRVGAAG
jgi:hypothetical protein